jgi:transcriptional regulator GlxA family with amidase domain
LLRESQMTVTEITYAVGFSDLKHFRSLFLEHFGMLPGEYAGRAWQEKHAQNEPGTPAPRAKE